jgi:hypothetical protein
MVMRLETIEELPTEKHAQSKNPVREMDPLI